eukprot:1922368-Rhodomonas_salina.1
MLKSRPFTLCSPRNRAGSPSAKTDLLCERSRSRKSSKSSSRIADRTWYNNIHNQNRYNNIHNQYIGVADTQEQAAVGEWGAVSLLGSA